MSTSIGPSYSGCFSYFDFDLASWIVFMYDMVPVWPRESGRIREWLARFHAKVLRRCGRSAGECLAGFAGQSAKERSAAHLRISTRQHSGWRQGSAERRAPLQWSGLGAMSWVELEG